MIMIIITIITNMTMATAGRDVIDLGRQSGTVCMSKAFP